MHKIYQFFQKIDYQWIYCVINKNTTNNIINYEHQYLYHSQRHWFQQEFSDTRLIKFTNFVNDKFDFSYQEGLNEDIVEFDPYKLCVAGGLHFCKYEQLEKWIAVHHEGYPENYYYWDIEIPNDAVVVQTDTKFKSNKIIMKNRQIIKENMDISAKYISEYPDFLYTMSDPSIDMITTSFDKTFNRDDFYLVPTSCRGEDFVKFEKFVRDNFPNSEVYQQLFSKFVDINPYIVAIFTDKSYEEFYSLEFIEDMIKKAVSMNMQLFDKFENFEDSILDEFIQSCPYIIKLFKQLTEQQIIKAISIEPDVYRFIDCIHYNNIINSYATEMRPFNIKYIQQECITSSIARTVLNKDETMLQFIPASIQTKKLFQTIINGLKINI